MFACCTNQDKNIVAGIYFSFFPSLFLPLQRINTENTKQISPEKELRGHNRNFHIHVSVAIDLPILLQIDRLQTHECAERSAENVRRKDQPAFLES